MDLRWLAVAVGAVLLLSVLLLVRRRRSGSARRSKRAHVSAQDRDPPVELGEEYEFGVKEFTDHHSGERVAVGKVEGFVLFASDIPESVDAGDVIRVRVLSFNRGRSSAGATFVARA